MFMYLRVTQVVADSSVVLAVLFGETDARRYAVGDETGIPATIGGSASFGNRIAVVIARVVGCAK